MKVKEVILNDRGVRSRGKNGHEDFYFGVRNGTCGGGGGGGGEKRICIRLR